MPIQDILTLARRDWRRFNKSAFQVSLAFQDPTTTQSATVLGKGQNNHGLVESEGTVAYGKIFHIAISEAELAEVNPLYPIRDRSNKVSMHGHLVDFTDSNGTLLNYRVTEVLPDNTVGMIMLELEQVE